jgi:AcrR family transcriptional regulator
VSDVPTTISRTERRRAVVLEEILATAWTLAGEGGVAAVTLKNVAERMGIKPPSLYEYVPNLYGLFNLMFQAGWRALLIELEGQRNNEADLRGLFRALLDFCVADPTRFELMLQRPVPGFTPSDDAMALAQEVYDAMRNLAAGFGIVRQQDFDLIDSLLLGLVGNQIANDPGGTRFIDLADEAVDMIVRNIKRRTR